MPRYGTKSGVAAAGNKERPCYDELVTARHAELRQLTEQVEQHQAERARQIVQLAQLRGVSPTHLIDALGLRPPSARDCRLAGRPPHGRPEPKALAAPGLWPNSSASGERG